MISKNTGKIMAADGIRPCFDKRFDLNFCRSALQRHGSRSGCLAMYVLKDERPDAYPTREQPF
jgi:hypothetical protein